MRDDTLEWMPAREAVAAMTEGRISARDLTEACLASIDRQEDTIGAWTWLDRDHALAQADACDDLHRAGGPHGRCTACRSG